MPEEQNQPVAPADQAMRTAIASTAVGPQSFQSIESAPGASAQPARSKKLGLLVGGLLLVVLLVAGYFILVQRNRVSAADITTTQADVQKMYAAVTSKDPATSAYSDKTFDQQITAIEKLSVMHDKKFTAALNDFKTNTLPRSHHVLGMLRGLAALDGSSKQLSQDATWTGPTVTSNAAAVQLFQQKQKAFSTAATNLKPYADDPSSDITQEYLQTVQKSYQDIATLFGTAADSVTKGKDTLTSQLTSKISAVNKDLSASGLGELSAPDLASTVDPADLYQVVNTELSADTQTVTNQLTAAGTTYKAKAVAQATKELQPPFFDNLALKVQNLQSAAAKLRS